MGDVKAHEAQELAWQCMLAARNVGTPCGRCRGSGVRLYGSTATWRGGLGGASMTSDVCDNCWGTGDAHRKGADLRRLTAQRQAWEAEQCAKWLAERAGLSFATMRVHLLALAAVVGREANRRKPAGVEPHEVFWYQRSAEAFAATIVELAGKPKETP